IGKKGEISFVEHDETIRPDTSLEKLSTLPPAFRKGGSVTAGNSSSLNDGAAMVLMASEKAVKQFNLQPMARYITSSAVGVDPRYMGIGPVYAIRRILANTGMTIEDIGLVEINEAFAAQALACKKELSIVDEQLNIHGGAIAIGHPLGMSGARISGALLRNLHRTNHRYGIAALCIGVGQGLAVLYERV
ncbi:MAG: thiolase family protein, partial [Candidatus Kapaibacterium sp.]